MLRKVNAVYNVENVEIGFRSCTCLQEYESASSTSNIDLKSNSTSSLFLLSLFSDLFYLLSFCFFVSDFCYSLRDD